MNLSGLIGNVSIPRQTGGGTASWISETSTVTAADQTFGQVVLTPKKLAAATAYTKELLAQSSIDIEAFVRMDLMTVIAIAKDLGALSGIGANGQPLGILNTSGIGSVTFGGVSTFAKAVEFETTTATANALLGNIAYVTTPATRGKWKGIQKATNYPVYIWDNPMPDGSGTVNGYKAYATKQVPSDKVIFGNWNDLILADWAGIDITVDPYSLSTSGQVRIVIMLLTDTAIRHAASFTVSSDSGAQ